ncbi:hypothetical protein CFK39_13975 [Brachybacterium avium]|uniref:DUF6318 domain-containing protein n=1 Tax=Brachybacterium avium TaxID=2017485 RepID=A0A220UG84_9MICO|nr:DUF6318 family protein [Brachybacterium avium]ASK66733.1 hypothetical protein CFK39_13975 [Brachybacterium avium]
MLRRLLSAAATGALLLGLAACDEPIDGPATAAPPSIDIAGPSDGGGDAEPSDGGGGPTDEPTAEAPDIPAPDPADFAGMDEHTPEGAEQAFRYYIAVSMWAHQTGNTTILTNLQGESCGGCAFLNEDIAQVEASGIYWSDFEINDTGTAVHNSTNYDHEIGYVFTLSNHSRPNENYTGSINVESIEYVAIGGMDWNGNQWITSGMTVEWGDDVHSD